jgi:thiamine-phosphate pyrophosphorylase
MPFTLPPIYPITDKALSHRTSHLVILKELIRGGARLVQIRDKGTPARDLLLDLLRCVDFSSQKGVKLIINDRCDLALSSGSSGVHLGQDDLPAEAARSLLGARKIIGLSTHTPAQVRRANRLPVHYLGYGPVFATSTKQNTSQVIGIEGLRRACRLSDKPVVAIGGIRPSEVRSVLDAGAASAAVISALMKAKSIAAEMERLLALAGISH